MKPFIIALFATLLVFGCSKERSDDQQAANSAAAKPDNTGRNAGDEGKTAQDQSENEQDRTISQEVRKAVTSDDSLSTTAKNVKIITNDGNVTLRGPVKSEKEKTDIESKAKQIAGVKNVDNQLEVTN